MAGPGGPDHRPPPVGEEDRDRAVERLHEAYGEGRLSDEELDERLHEVLTATTGAELRSALASLPEEHAGAASTIAAVSGRIRRRGAWRVPRTLTVASALGSVHLDLSRAVIDHPVVDIELQVGTGSARITVPRDAVVDIEGLQTGRRQALHKARRRARPGGPRIRISGFMGLGRLTIRHAWR
ncbi:DUF1707 domain-containing protein [Kitasatospora sp. NPDC085464]|uniref:DUF1707 SHOCT-like domain-containing protein n=1 Tax=Kitasatospora sp. NPDC085464 TaxID=3364063 RepID=UPI0037C633BA